MKSIFIRYYVIFFKVIWHYRAVILAQLALLVVGAVLISYVEKLPLGDALYFSFITGLTIGYGDVVVKTFLGRCIAVTLGLIGTIFCGFVVGAALRAVQKTYHPG